MVAGCISCPSLHLSTKARILLHFVPRFGRERDRGGEPGYYSRLSVHLASAGQLLRKKEKPSLVFFLPPLFSAFLFPFFFLFWRQISRIKYGSHMLLLTIGIHRGTGPTATQTDGQKEEEGRRRRQRGEQFLRVRCGGEYTVPLRAVSHSSVWESLCKLNETVIPIELN